MSGKNVSTQESGTTVCKGETFEVRKIGNADNKARICGIIKEEFERISKSSQEEFYETKVEVERLSGTKDYVPIIVSSLLMPEVSTEKFEGKYVQVGGSFCSSDMLGEDGRSHHLKLFLFATIIDVYESEEAFEKLENPNLIYLKGTICKEPFFRTTPRGREVTDLMLAVKRTSEKTDYIPCVVWGMNARYASILTAGDEIEVYGRIQSRVYFKSSSPDSEYGEYKNAYEVSISELYN